MYLHTIPLQPRRGNVLRVLAMIRVSTRKQRRSLGAQKSLLIEFVEQYWGGEIEWIFISTCASGEFLEREELLTLVEYATSGKIDLVVCEDLARIARDQESRHLCGICVDCQVRVLAINDYLDTCDPNWRDHAMFLSWRDEKYNDSLSSKLKGRLRERFKEGGALPKPIAGYIVPKEHLPCRNEKDS